MGGPGKTLHNEKAHGEISCMIRDHQEFSILTEFSPKSQVVFTTSMTTAAQMEHTTQSDYREGHCGFKFIGGYWLFLFLSSFGWKAILTDVLDSSAMSVLLPLPVL